MISLSKLKEWLTIHDAAMRLASLFNEEISEADILRLSLDGHLSLSIFLPSRQSGVRTTIKPVNISELYPDLCVTENIMIDGSSDEDIQAVQDGRYVLLEGLFNIPMVFGNRQEIEKRYQKMIGSKEMDSSGEIILERKGEYFELQSLTRKKGLVNRTKNILTLSPNSKFDASLCFPDDSLIVVRNEALLGFEKSLIETSTTTDKTHSRAHVSDKLAALNQAATKFWANADQNDRTTHHNQSEVIAWLMDHGFSEITAKSGATIIRPEWAPTGKKPKE